MSSRHLNNHKTVGRYREGKYSRARRHSDAKTVDAEKLAHGANNFDFESCRDDDTGKEARRSHSFNFARKLAPSAMISNGGLYDRPT